MKNKVLLTILFVLLTTSLPGSVSTSCPLPISGSIMLDGNMIGNQVTMIQTGGQLYLPLEILANQWHPGTADSSVVFHAEQYVPARLITETMGYLTIWEDQTGTMVIFSQPLVSIPADQETAMAQKLAGYFNQTIHGLPRDLGQIKAIYHHYIHPDDLEMLAESLHQAASTPTHWGTTEYLESELVAATRDYAAVRYKIRYQDGQGEEYIQGVWGFKRYQAQWLMRW